MSAINRFGQEIKQKLIDVCSEGIARQTDWKRRLELATEGEQIVAVGEEMVAFSNEMEANFCGDYGKKGCSK